MLRSQSASYHKPAGALEVNWADPLTEGLIGLFVFNEDGGSIRNLVDRTEYTWDSSAGTPTVGPEGPAILFNGSSQYIDTGLYPDSTYQTLIWRGRLDDLGSGDYGNIGCHDTSNHRFYSGTSNNSVDVAFAWGSGFTSSASHGQSVGDYATWAMTRRGTTVYCYVDGADKGSFSPGFSGTSSRPIILGARAIGSTNIAPYHEGTYEYVIISTRSFSEREIKDIDRLVWTRMVRPRRRWVPVVAAGGTTVDADQPMVISWEAVRQADATALTEYTAQINMDAQAPAEWRLGVAADTPAPAEYAQTAQSDAALPVESAGTVGVDAGLRAEWTAALASSQAVLVEYLGTAVADAAAPIAWRLGVVADAAIPVEWAGVALINADAPLPIDWAAAVFADTPIGAEWLGRADIDARAPVSYRAQVDMSATVAVESLLGIDAEARLPMEWGGGILIDADAPMPIEWRGSVAAAQSLPLEHVTIIRVDGVVPLEAGAGLVADQDAALEYLAGIGVTAPMLAENRAVVTIDTAMPVEWDGVAEFMAGNTLVWSVDSRGFVWSVAARSFVWDTTQR